MNVPQKQAALNQNGQRKRLTLARGACKHAPYKRCLLPLTRPRFKNLGYTLAQARTLQILAEPGNEVNIRSA